MRRGATAASLIPTMGQVCAAASDQAEFLNRTNLRLEPPPGASGTNCKTSCSSGDRRHCLHQRVCIARPVVAASIFLGYVWPPAVLAVATADALTLTGVAALQIRPADTAALQLRHAAGAVAAAAVAVAIGSPITAAAAAAAPPSSPPQPRRLHRRRRRPLASLAAGGAPEAVVATRSIADAAEPGAADAAGHRCTDAEAIAGARWKAALEGGEARPTTDSAGAFVKIASATDPRLTRWEASGGGGAGGEGDGVGLSLDGGERSPLACSPTAALAAYVAACRGRGGNRSR